MPIRQSEMTQPQQIAVAKELSESLDRSLALPEHDEYHTAPIVAGLLRHSKSGSPWACFGKVCFRLVDIQVDDDVCTSGGFIPVLDDDGNPLGRSGGHKMGVLVVGEVRGRTTAFVCNTGWNTEDEIKW